MERVHLMVDAQLKHQLKEIGNGNYTDGVRKAVQFWLLVEHELSCIDDVTYQIIRSHQKAIKG